MKLIKIEYERKINLGDYESEMFKMEFHLEGLPGEAEKAIKGAKAFIEKVKTDKNGGYNG